MPTTKLNITRNAGKERREKAFHVSFLFLATVSLLFFILQFNPVSNLVKEVLHITDVEKWHDQYFRAIIFASLASISFYLVFESERTKDIIDSKRAEFEQELRAKEKEFEKSLDARESSFTTKFDDFNKAHQITSQLLQYPKKARDEALRDADLYSQILKYQEIRDYKSVANYLLKIQNEITSNLARGIVRVPMELCGQMQYQLMQLNCKQMDAVSYDDLALWNHIFDNHSTDDGSANNVSDHFLRRYHEVIKGKIRNDQTKVTRIFVVDRDRLDGSSKQIHLLSRVLKDHIDSHIGIALAFKENFSYGLESDLKSGDFAGDFALLDLDVVATFFKHNVNRFEAVFGFADKALIERQRRVHKTFIVASIIGTDNFASDSYSSEEWNSLKSEIEKHRSNRPDETFQNDLFHIIFEDAKKESVEGIKLKIQDAIKISKYFGEVVELHP